MRTSADPGCRSCVPASPQAAASPCDDVRVTDEVLADQVDYYRRRAGEYDATAYGDVAAARARIARLVAEMRPAGSEGWSEEKLADLVTRDAMIGTDIPRVKA